MIIDDNMRTEGPHAKDDKEEKDEAVEKSHGHRTGACHASFRISGSGVCRGYAGKRIVQF